MSASSEKVVAPLENPDRLEHAESGIVRVPYQAITRPLTEQAVEGLRPGFIEEQRLADLLFRKRIRRAGRGLMFCDGVVYELHEAVRIDGPQAGSTDPYGLTGTVERLDELQRAGGSVGPMGMHLGSATYRVVRGLLAVARSSEAPLAG